MTQKKAILKLKQVKPNDQQVKATLKIAEGVKVKETISTFRNGDAKELLINLVFSRMERGSRSCNSANKPLEVALIATGAKSSKE
jgi:hypothetical protein